MEGRGKVSCKVRKRGCYSSSSSSSRMRNSYRFKRAVLVAKRGGSSTPVPTWKMRIGNFDTLGVLDNGGKGKQSARKLGATLWEINEVASPTVKEDCVKRDVKIKERITSILPPRLSDPSHSPVSEILEESLASSHRRRSSRISQKLQLTDHTIGSLESQNNACLMEVGVNARLKDVSNGLSTSKELLKALNHIWGLEDKHSPSVSLVMALRVELDRARNQVNQLIQDQHSKTHEINHLMKHFAEEKAAWKSKERERIHNAVASIAEGLEVEKKLRRRTERMNKKLARELAETKSYLCKALKKLESEKRAREIMEEVCDELAKGIGEDRAEVEEMKRESAKAREEMEREREMLQLADVLREERVQMKLSEARYQFEEKNVVVDNLRNELEAYLSEIGKENGDGTSKSEQNQDLMAFLRKTRFRSCENGEENVDDGEDSAESDLHSIELNVDNDSNCYKWSYGLGFAAKNGSKRGFSVDEEIKETKSISEKSLWQNGITNGIEWDPDGFESGRLSVQNQTPKNGSDDEIERYKSLKSLRDHILSGLMHSGQ